MSEAPSLAVAAAGSRRASTLSICGLFFGAIAALAAIAPYVLHEWREPEKRSLSEVVRGAIRNSSAEKTTVERPLDWQRISQSVSLGGGGIAILLGIFGWVRRENARTAVAAIALGALPIAWYVAFLAFIVVIILAALATFASVFS